MQIGADPLQDHLVAGGELDARFLEPHPERLVEAQEVFKLAERRLELAALPLARIEFTRERFLRLVGSEGVRLGRP